ncbi:MAG: TonB-dependent receptor [Acidobacteriota bacterium]
MRTLRSTGSMRLSRFALAFLLLLAPLLLSLPLAAQAPGIGALRGQVVDASGAPIGGAVISVWNEDTGFTRTVSTDALGTYAFSGLPLTGHYEISFAHEGLAAEKRSGLELRAGATATADAVLQALPVEDAITVYGTTEGVHADSPQIGTRMDAERIAETPILGGKVTALPLLNSAVRSARGTGDLFLNNTLFVIEGGGRRQATYVIDGSGADDSWGRQTIFTNVPLAAIQEFSVLTNAFSAEYGRTTGGAINLVTRAGTHDLKGDFNLTGRPGGLQSKTPVTQQDAQDELWQGSVFVGGQLIPDRAYFSFGGEYNRQDRDSVITSALAPGVFTGEYRQSLLFGRIDADLSPAHHLVGRANLDRFTDSNPADAVGGIALPSAARTFKRAAEAAQLAESWVVNGSTSNDARLVWQNGDPITEFEPAHPSTQFVRPGVSTEGESRVAHLTNRQVQFADTVSVIAGEHLIKAGGDYVRSRSGGDGQEFGSPFTLGQFTFKTGISPTIPTSALKLSDVARFTQGFGNVDYKVTESLWSLFAQDDYRVRPDLVLNLGLRYDRQSLTDATDNISPRLGFAWTPGKSAKTTYRGGYGIYYSEIRANIVAGWELGGPQGFFNFSAAPGQLGFPTSLNPLPAFPPGAVLPPRDITIRPGRASFYNQFFDVSKLSGYPSELKNPKTAQATLGAEHDFGGGWFGSADVVHAVTTDIDRNIDLNAPSAFVRTTPGQTRSAAAADLTRPIVPVANGYRRILVTINQGESRYDALQLDLRHEWSGRGSLRLSYTWSHTRNNFEADAPGGDPSDARLLGSEFGDSLLDQRHRVVISGAAHLPFGFVAGGVGQYATGRPYNATTGADNNGDGSNADRPVIDGNVISRNAFRGDNLYDLTLFVERGFRVSGAATLTLRAEVFNITDHENVVGRNAVYGNATTAVPLSTFGQELGGIANVDPGRQFQLGARLRF